MEDSAARPISKRLPCPSRACSFQPPVFSSGHLRDGNNGRLVVQWVQGSWMQVVYNNRYVIYVMYILCIYIYIYMLYIYIKIIYITYVNIHIYAQISFIGCATICQLCHGRRLLRSAVLTSSVGSQPKPAPFEPGPNQGGIHWKKLTN